MSRLRPRAGAAAAALVRVSVCGDCPCCRALSLSRAPKQSNQCHALAP